jgi:hypothetical protein
MCMCIHSDKDPSQHREGGYPTGHTIAMKMRASTTHIKTRRIEAPKEGGQASPSEVNPDKHTHGLGNTNPKAKMRLR